MSGWKTRTTMIKTNDIEGRRLPLVDMRDSERWKST